MGLSRFHDILQGSAAPPGGSADPDYAEQTWMTVKPDPALILASSSPYRKELLERLRIPFTIVPPMVDETPLAGETPEVLARRLARVKAEAVASRSPSAWVIGSDQVATLDGHTPIGKPGNLDNARRQLAAASGKTMQFHTAFALVGPDHPPIEGSVPVTVDFRVLDDDEIERYLVQEQPFDCAGSARCEGLGIALLRSIRTDDPTALIGLPLIQVAAALRAVGLPPI
jgi:septum formation protein